MNRENEDDSEFAGCNLMRWLRDNNFIKCKKMIFTSDQEKAVRKLNKYNVDINEINLQIVINEDEAINFVEYFDES
jgi:hypothetical protein